MLRREFLASTLLAPMMSYEGPFGDHRKVALFTDHLAGFQIKEVANMLNQLGVIGPDLTVRPGGLVDPRRAAEELPKAAKIFAERGLTIPMITTAITSIRSPGCQAILSTAAGWEFVTINWVILDIRTSNSGKNASKLLASSFKNLSS